MHLELVVGAVAEQLRAARPEVREPSDVLLGRRARRLVEADRGHARQRYGAGLQSRLCHPWPTPGRSAANWRPRAAGRPVARGVQAAGTTTWLTSAM